MFGRVIWDTFSKITRVIYPKNCPKQQCSYWLISPNQQTLSIKTDIFYQQAITNQQVGITKELR